MYEMTLTYLLIASLCVMVASLSGKLVTWRVVGPLIEKNLSFLVSFAAGVLLIIVYGLIGELIEHAGSLSMGMPWVVAGAVFVLVAFRYLPDFHHHHDSNADTHVHGAIDANRILLSDGIHNITDGILLAAAFSVSPVLGVFTAMSVFVHELVQEISEFFVLRQAGMSAQQALLWNFISSSTILIGAIGGYFLLERFEALEVPILGLAAGSYLIVVFHDLIPHSIRASRSKIQYIKHVAWFIGGLVVMGILELYVGH